MIDRRVGRWCIHHRRDSGGDRLLEMMNKVSLTCASTYFQPCRKKNNSTFMNIEKGKPPSQIDYILISERWSTAAVDCKTLWGPSIYAHGRKWDHAMVKLTFKIRLKSAVKQPSKNFAALKRVDVANAHNQQIMDAVFPEQEGPQTTCQQWEHLKRTMISAQESIPHVDRRVPGRRWETSVDTKRLIGERASK